MNQSSIEDRMNRLGFDINYIITIDNFIDRNKIKYLGYNKDWDFNRLVLCFKGNNDSDLIYIYIPNDRKGAVKVNVYRDRSKYQTHIFVNIVEFLERCKSPSWWDFNHIKLSDCLLNCNFGI